MPPDTVPPRDAELQRSHTATFLRWLAPMALFFGALDMVVAVVWGQAALAAVGAVGLAIAGTAWAARWPVRWGRPDLAVALVGAVLLAGGVLIVAVEPTFFPAVAWISFLVVALCLPYVRRREMLALLVSAWLGTIVVALIGVVAAPAAYGTPLLRTLLIGAVAAGSALALLLLWQFSTHLTDALDRTTAANDELRQAQRRLTEADRARTEFFNNAAHQLRTPLTPLLLQLHLLKREPGQGPSTRQERAADTIERNALRLNALVDDLVEVARTQAGRLDLKPARVELGERVQKTVDDVAEDAKTAGVRVRVEPAAAVTLQTDGSRVREVLGDLLRSAIRASPSGGQVVVRAIATPGQAVVEVEEPAPAAAGHAPLRTLEPFSELDAVMPPGATRTGLRLFLCSEIAKALGGRLSLEPSGSGRGTMFRLTLPLEWTAPSGRDTASA